MQDHDAEAETFMDESCRQANAASTWTFLLEPSDDGGCTRLVVRWRARWDLLSSPMSFMIGVVLDPIKFVMEQKMMRGSSSGPKPHRGRGTETQEITTTEDMEAP